MTLFGLLKALHLVGVSYFFGFLLLDLFVLRSFLSTECHEKKLLFYKKAKTSLHIFVTIILGSGFWMLYLLDFCPPFHIWLKISFAVAAITLFFASPYMVARLSKGSVGYVYAVVLMLAVAALVLGAGIR